MFQKNGIKYFSVESWLLFPSPIKGLASRLHQSFTILSGQPHAHIYDTQSTVCKNVFIQTL